MHPQRWPFLLVFGFFIRSRKMENKLKATPISSDDFASSRPGFPTAAVGVAAALSLIVLYYWPLIREQLGL
jgi:hypothetical protein